MAYSQIQTPSVDESLLHQNHGTSRLKSVGITDYSIQNTAYLLAKCGIDDYYDDIAKLENHIDPKHGYATHEVYESMNHCYKYEDAPANQYIAQWKHIGNAMKHELYEEISKTFMEIINDKTKYKTDVGGDILFTLRNKTKIDTNEIKYIEQLIKRTMMFFHPFKCNNISQEYAVKSDQNPLFAEDNKVMNGLNMSTLCDIYNVHNCFLFMNFNFKQYDTDEFVVEINKSGQMNEVNKIQINIQDISHMKFNLFSSYIIDDDMYSICNYFIAASHLVNKIGEKNNKYMLKVTVIPSKIVCVYDNSIYPLNIHDVYNFMDHKPIKISSNC